MATSISNQSGENLIFICGCGHSGTTLLWAMLSAHSKVYGIPYETCVFLNSRKHNKRSLNWFRRIIVQNYFSMLPKGEQTKFMASTNAGYMSFTRTDPNIISFFNSQLELARKNNKDIVCEKTPRHVRQIDRIKTIFPQSNIVILVRNGLDVIASLKERRGDFDAAMHRWLNDNKAMLDAKKRYPLHIVKYENLVTNPEYELRGISRFCGLQYEEEMITYYNRPSDNMWKLELRKEQVYKPITDRRGRWKGTLTSDEILKFRDNAGDLMKHFGYTFD